MSSVGDAGEAAERLAHALEAPGLPYAIGGAPAMGAHGYPRGTLDVDVNVFVELTELSRVLSVLRELGTDVDDETARARAERDKMFVARFGRFGVHVFVPSIPFSWEAERTRVRVTAGDIGCRFLAPEAVVVFKLLFFRGKCASTSSASWRRGAADSITRSCDDGWWT